MNRDTQTFIVAMTLILGCFGLLILQPRLGLEPVALFGFATGTIGLVAGHFLGQRSNERGVETGQRAGPTVVSETTTVSGSPVRVEPQDREG